MNSPLIFDTRNGRRRCHRSCQLKNRMAMSSEIPPDDISRPDEPALDVAGASRNQFMSGNIDLRQPVLQEMGSARLLVVSVRLEQPPKFHLEDEDSGEKGSVKWEVKLMLLTELGG